MQTKYFLILLLIMLLNQTQTLRAEALVSKQNQAATQQEISNAWQVLKTRNSGKIEKIKALEFLARNNQSLVGIDMSGKTNGNTVGWGFYLVGLNLNNLKSDLHDANFEESNLMNANFATANLTNANFTGSRLINSYFAKANMTNVNFHKAYGNPNFQDANLSGAKFISANFGGANFSGADLNNTDFIEVNLTYTKFEQSLNFGKATFSNNYIRINDDEKLLNNDKLNFLPKTPKEYRFDFDGRVKAITPIQNNAAYGAHEYYIKLILNN
jgi:uncharacterized protein YjbI with pentapeptide repeats